MTTGTRKPVHILLAVDGSEHASAGVQMVRDLPLPSGSTLTLLSAFLPRNAANLREYEANVRQGSEILAGKDAILREEIIAGIPGEVISQYATNFQVDLIVMGARGLRSAFGILMGGVAQQVVEYAERPVMVMRAPYLGFHNCLLVTDGSTCSDVAMNYLDWFPLPQNSTLHVMHVLPPPPIPQSVMIAYAWPVSYAGGEYLQEQEKEQTAQLMQAEELHGREVLDRTIAHLSARRPDLALASALRRGDAAAEILNFVQDNKVDLIIAGSRGLSNVRGWLLGSVSRKLLHYASCSVLIVRGQPGCLASEES